ncbi:fibronectin type III-like domain-contianing protein [Microbacterium lacticum]
MFANPKSAAGLIILGIFVLVAIFAPLIAPYDPTAQHLDHTLEPPSWQFPLGTTHIGEDVFSQIIYGTRGVLVVGFLATITSWADKELKAYRHVDLAPGAEETVELEVPVADCTIVDATGARIAESGAFELLIGSSSRDEDLRSVSFTVAAA